MNALLMATFGALAGFGVLLVIMGIRGHELLPRPSRRAVVGAGAGAGAAASRANRLAIRLLAGLVLGTLVFLLTHWPVAAAATVGLVAALPILVGGRSEQRVMIDRTQAIASWTEMIRDNLAGAAGLEQALLATAPLAPRAIAAEVGRLEARLERQEPLADALAGFGDDLAHPSADLVVVAIAKASRMEVRDLNPLLSRLADSIRDDVRMRLRVEVSRTRIRQSSRIVVGATIAAIVLLFVLGRNLLEAYDSVNGQLWMCVVVADFVGAGWLIHRYAKLTSPARFALRRSGPPPPPAPTGSPGPAGLAGASRPGPAALGRGVGR